jgi:hypothetical protein
MSISLPTFQRYATKGSKSVALEADPGFAVAHATKAALDFEQRDLRDCALHFHAALESLARGSTTREQAYVRAVGQRIHGDRFAYRAYAEAYPEDPIGLALAIPTIAFSGAYDSPIDAWHRLDELKPLHGDIWWFTGLLAFARVEQGDLEGAAELADRSLRDEPHGGTAAHARALNTLWVLSPSFGGRLFRGNGRLA